MRSTDTHDAPGGRGVLAGVLVALVALAALTAPAAAGYDDTVTIHVNDDWAANEDGDVVGDGYEFGHNATATVQAAINKAGDGDNVVVYDGTYNESILIEKDITVKAATDYGATIRYAPDSSTGQPTVKIADDGEFGGPTLTGFQIERVAADDRSQGDAFAQAVRVSANDTRVVGNDVTGVGFEVGTNAGIMVVDGESGAATGETVANVEVHNNDVAGFAAPLSAAANYGGSVGNVSFDANTLSGNAVDGLALGERDGSLSNVTLDHTAYTGTDGQADTTWLFKSEAAALDWGANASEAVLEDASGDHLVGDGMSIQDAVDAAAAGDTVTVESGTYAGFTLQTNVTVAAADGATPTVDADEGVGSDGRVVDVRDSGGDADNATVAGLAVDATGQSDYTVGVSVSADDVTVRGVSVTGDANVTGIQTQTGYDGAGTNGVLVTDSTVENANVGVSLQSGNDTATNNTITGAVTEGIGLDGTENDDVSGNDVDTAGDAPDIRIYGAVTAEVDAANDLLADNPGVETVAFDASGNDYARDVSIDGTYYHSVQAALDAAQSGDAVRLADGAYDLGSEGLDVATDNVTVEGESMDGVVLDGSDAPWSVHVENRSDVTLRNLTVDGYDGGDAADDTIKAAFVDGFTVENVAVNGSAGNELDLNNVRNATLRNVDALGENTTGVGVALSGVRNVTLDGVHTAGNDWGGVGLYDVADDVSAPDGWTLVQNTSDVTVTEASDLSETVSLYADQEFGGALGDLYAPAYDYAVENPDHRERGEDFVYYAESQADAVSLALGLTNDSSSTVRTLATDADGEIDLGSTYVVGAQDGDSMRIQTAVDAAATGDTVRIAAGTYNESVTVDEELTLVGAGAGESVVSPENGTGLLVAGHTPASGESVDGVTIDGFTVDAADGEFGVAAFSETHSTDYDTTNLTVRNVAVDGTDALGVGLFSAANATLDNVTVSGVSDASTGALELAGVADLSVTDSALTDNALGVNLFDASGYGANADVTVTDTTFTGNDVHVADTTSALDAQTLVDANAFDVTSRVAADDSAALTLYGSAQGGVDAAQSGDTVLVTGEVADGITVGTANVTVAGVDDVTVTSNVGFEHGEHPDDVTISGFAFADTETAINANDAGDNLTVVDNEFDGVGNALLHGGQTGGQDSAKTGWLLAGNTVSDAGNGFRLWNTGELTVFGNDFENLSGSAVSLIAVDGATVANNTFADTTKAGVFVDGPFSDAFDTNTTNVTISGNTFDAAGDNESTEYAQASVLTGSNLAALGQVDVRDNAFLNASPHAIYADAGADANGTVDARLNWFGSADGPAADEVVGPVTYDPFLTAPPSETSDDLQAYGHDFVVPGDGAPRAVGFPADVNATYGELFCDYDGVVYVYDADAEQWEQVDADRQVDPLDAVVVVADERIEVSVDYADAASDELTTPGETDLAAGWNFVAAPQHDTAEEAFAVTAGGTVERVVSQFDTAESAPYGWDGDDFGTYTPDQTGHASAVAPTVSPYGGYWVYASDDGSLAGAMYPGMPHVEMLAALNDLGGSQ